jgi:pimeloyl-ACP methyl ester carboxylesterase
VPDERKTPLETIIAGKPALISLREWRIAKPQAQVICLHGLGVTGAEYAPMAASLNRAGFDVLAPDWIGHGDSEYIGNPQAYEWNCYFKCLATVFRHSHTPATHYVGASWGAAILLIFLLSRGILPRSSTFVDLALRRSPLLAGHVRTFHDQIEQKFASVAEAKAFLAIQRPEFARVPEEFRDYLDTERYYRKGEYIAFKFDPAILPALDATSSASFDYVGALKRIRFNALFLYGAKSSYRLPLEFMTICAQAPHIRYRDDLPGGHPPTLLYEEQFSKIVDYIKQANLIR